MFGKKHSSAEQDTALPKAAAPVNEKCRLDGHVSREIDDNGQPGQIFWCERCGSTRRVTFNASAQQVVVTELPPARALKQDAAA